MSRPPRVDFSGAMHHVMNRGARRQNIFLHDRNRYFFCKTLGELPERYGITIHGYVLMPNHYHLRVVSNRGELSMAMAFLQSQYCRRLNWEQKWDGPLFRGRFRNRLIYREDDWIYLLAYLHLNPIRSQLVMDLDNFVWSSHNAYLGSVPCPTWLDTQEVKTVFGSTKEYLSFINNVRSGERPIPDEFNKVLFRTSETRVSIEPEPKRAKEQIANVLDDVVHVTGKPLKQILKTTRGAKGNPCRIVALYWLVTEANISITEAARIMKMQRPTASKVFHRVRYGLYKNKKINVYLDNLLRLQKKKIE